MWSWFAVSLRTSFGRLDFFFVEPCPLLVENCPASRPCVMQLTARSIKLDSRTSFLSLVKVFWLSSAGHFLLSSLVPYSLSSISSPSIVWMSDRVFSSMCQTFLLKYHLSHPACVYVCAPVCGCELLGVCTLHCKPAPSTLWFVIMTSQQGIPKGLLP